MDTYHLTKMNVNWKLTKEGNSKASKSFDGSKSEAIKESADFLKSGKGGSMKIHKENGRIQEERTYPKSKDPRKSKG